MRHGLALSAQARYIEALSDQFCSGAFFVQHVAVFVILFSFALPKGAAKIQVEMDGAVVDVPDSQGVALDRATLNRPDVPASPADAIVSVPLIKLAWARSGDKGDKANIGVIARKPEYLPYIYAALTEQAVADRFGHFLPAGATGKSQTYVERYLMPGTDAINFLIHDVLGGGGMASIRNDAQGKGYGQLMLDAAIPVSAAIASQLK